MKINESWEITLRIAWVQQFRDSEEYTEKSYERLITVACNCNINRNNLWKSKKTTIKKCRKQKNLKKNKSIDTSNKISKEIDDLDMTAKGKLQKNNYFY